MGCQPGMGQLGTSGDLCLLATLSLCPRLNYGILRSRVPAPYFSMLAAEHGGGLHPLPTAAPQKGS